MSDPTPHPVPRAPAPWTLKAESYLLFLKLKALPAGVYDGLERAWESEEMGAWEGGLGVVMIVRYGGTPVGAYDELMLIPGNFSTPRPPTSPLKIPKSALRISRIYVSQRTTTYNGRLNWNIPKHLARFSFSAPPTLAGASPPASLRVQVFPPTSNDGDGVAPFFDCTLKPWTWLPAIPLNTRYVPLSMTAVQPPIPEPVGRKAAVESEMKGPSIDEYDVTADELPLCVGTERWCAFDIQAKVPRARGCWVSVGRGGVEDESVDGGEKYWPQDLRPWSVGAWCEEGVLDIGLPMEWKL